MILHAVISHVFELDKNVNNKEKHVLVERARKMMLPRCTLQLRRRALEMSIPSQPSEFAGIGN